MAKTCHRTTTPDLLPTKQQQQSLATTTDAVFSNTTAVYGVTLKFTSDDAPSASATVTLITNALLLLLLGSTNLCSKLETVS
jgi:hypothetical protein